MRRMLIGLRKLILVAIAIVVVLAAVVLANTLRQGSKQIVVSPAPKAAVDERAAAQRLAEAIRFQTISNFLNPDQAAGPLRAMHAHLAASFPAFHCFSILVISCDRSAA